MTSPAFVEGWIQRIELNPTITNQIATTTSLQQKVTLYAKNGIWYDTVATMAQMRLQNLEDTSYKADWDDLLSTIDLSTLASESIKGLESKDKKSLVSEFKP